VYFKPSRCIIKHKQDRGIRKRRGAWQRTVKDTKRKINKTIKLTKMTVII